MAESLFESVFFV